MWHYLSCRRQFFVQNLNFFLPTRMAFRELSACAISLKYPHKKSVAHFRLHWCSEVLDYLTFTTTTTYVHAQRRELRCYSL